MAQQHINLGTAPAGIDGDTNRTANGKAEANFNELYAATSALNPGGAFKNKFINGNFDFWQRGTSSAASSVTRFCADRWKGIANGSTIALSQQPFSGSVGDGLVPYSPTYFHRVIAASTVGASNYSAMQHPIENVRTLAGQTATISFWAKADAAKNIAVELYQSFGTGGAPSAGIPSIGVTTITLTTVWQKFSATIVIPSIVGKTIGTNGDNALVATFWFEAGSTFNSRTNSLGQQSGTFDIAQVQLEPGAQATSFEMRPPQVELALCQRYFYVLRNPNGTAPYMTLGGGTVGNTGALISRVVRPWPVKMRATPAVTISAGLLFDGSTLVPLTSSGGVYHNRDGFEADLAASGGGLAVGRYGVLLITSGDSVQADAEL